MSWLYICRAIVQKYLLEKSRICCQAKNERNYHVFYYLLAGASESEKNSLALLPPHKYHYLNQVSQPFFYLTCGVIVCKSINIKFKIVNFYDQIFYFLLELELRMRYYRTRRIDIYANSGGILFYLSLQGYGYIQSK